MKPGKKTVHELDIDNCLADLRHDLGQATAVLNASAYVKDTTDVRTLVMMGNAAVAHAQEVLMGLRDLIDRK